MARPGQWNFMIVVVRRLIVGLRNPINYGASEATGSVRTATDMQVKRLWLQAWRTHVRSPDRGPGKGRR